jgi:hypothetical protein
MIMQLVEAAPLPPAPLLMEKLSVVSNWAEAVTVAAVVIARTPVSVDFDLSIR